MSVRTIEEVDLRDVCDLLNIPVRKGRIPCPNPEHQEKHSDNCRIRQAKGGNWIFNCYSCGAFGGATDLVRLAKNLPNKAAAFQWLRDSQLLGGEAPAKPIRRIDEKEYLAFVEIFLAPGGEDRAGWLMVKHLEWKREKVSFRQRVAQIIAKNRTLNERAFAYRQSQEKMRRWEETGEGFPAAAIEARIRKEREPFVTHDPIANPTYLCPDCALTYVGEHECPLPRNRKPFPKDLYVRSKHGKSVYNLEQGIRGY